MSDTNRTAGEVIAPFRSRRRTWEAFVAISDDIGAVNPSASNAESSIEQIRRKILRVPVANGDQAYFQASASVLCDLRLQGWDIRVRGRRMYLERPACEIDASLERERIRQMHGVGRSSQLMKASVQQFIRNLEKNRLGPQGWTSIFSLMRDGRELAEKLRKAQVLSDDQKLPYLKCLVKPYIQVVEERKRCEFTGIPLGEIWRYFRHTWATEYQTVPGRNLMILIRDAACLNHPVIGIAALASPVVHLSLRDSWIGWSPKQFVAEMQSRPTVVQAKWVQKKLAQCIDDIYIGDLVMDKIVTKRSVASPTEEAIASLEEEAVLARQRHRLHPQKPIHKTPAGSLSDAEWKRRAKTHLFRYKRCSTLAELLRARLRLKHAGFCKPTKEGLVKVLATSEGRLAIETIRKQIKAKHIGNDVLDISVCGAIAPYTDLLGGKLIAMLLTSPELVEKYTGRYGKGQSIIASCMAGRRVSRRPRLVALTTTSLYRCEPNQYTRVSIPTNEIGGAANERVAYKRLGHTRGQGSFHFSSDTIDLIEVLLSQEAELRSVNSIFGEGVSPRLRKVRAGLHACGFPVNDVLTHGSPRVQYGITLVGNLKGVLMEQQKVAKYLYSRGRGREVTEKIGHYWIRRWLLPRLTSHNTADRVEKHTLVNPINHGARVSLTRIPDEELLFAYERQ